MKLVDILARELKAWPEGAVLAVQDGGRRKTIKFGGYGCYPSIALMGLENVWQSKVWNCPASWDFEFGLLAEDWDAAIVTQAEWQAAVDALDIPKFPSDAPAWSGEGLPPVGAWCLVKSPGYKNSRFDRFVGKRVFIVAHDRIDGDPVAVFRMALSHDEFDYHALITTCFEPEKTPEQTAAEEREKAIEEMAETARKAAGFGINLADMEALYDAGYRKQVAP